MAYICQICKGSGKCHDKKYLFDDTLIVVPPCTACTGQGIINDCIEWDSNVIKPKTVIYVDMDDVMCTYSEAINSFKTLFPVENDPDNIQYQYPQSRPEFFNNLLDRPDAVKYVNMLRENSRYEVYILTAPSYRNPHCYTGKRLWVEKYFDLDFCQNLIICNNKGLCKGDILIDDHINGRGQENFEGELIHFGSERFDKWEKVYNYIINNY